MRMSSITRRCDQGDVPATLHRARSATMHSRPCRRDVVRTVQTVDSYAHLYARCHRAASTHAPDRAQCRLHTERPRPPKSLQRPTQSTIRSYVAALSPYPSPSRNGCIWNSNPMLCSQLWKPATRQQPASPHCHKSTEGPTTSPYACRSL